MTIGMALVGALIITYLGNAQASRSVIAMTQLAEDGQAGLSLMVQHLRQADYNPPVSATAGPRDMKVDGLALFACDSGFQAITGATSSLRCNSAAGPAAFSVAYIGDRFNTIPTSDTPPKATDCAGAGITALSDADGSYTVVQNRFYVSNGNLMCAGNGGASPFAVQQPFLENVEDLRLSFGVSAPLATATVASGYLSASEIGGLSGSAGVFADAAFTALSPAQRWGKVVSVRVCMVMRSPGAVMPVGQAAPQYYIDCNGTQIKTVDGRIRRAFTATVLLRNRVAAT